MNPIWIELRNIEKSYAVGFRQTKQVLKNISMDFHRGEIVGLVGESGSGKSTLGMILAGLLRYDAGELSIAGKVANYPFEPTLRRDVQILFQHPESSFDPRLVLEKSLLEPFKHYHIPYSAEILSNMLAPYGMTLEHLRRLPDQLSGGELQRLAIIRVLSLSPKLIVLDEPTSMLDPISQAQILGILKELNRTAQITYLFITHDIDVANSFCDRIFQMKSGMVRGLA